MNEGMNETPQLEPGDARLQESARKSELAWRRLGLRIKSVTPARLARDVLVLGVIALLLWLLSLTWVALIPFVVGSIIAYALLPIVNRLDRVMPRILAILIALVPVVALGALFFATLLPLAGEQLARLTIALPGREQLDAIRLQLQAYTATLPPNVQTMLRSGITQAETELQARSAQLLATFIRTGIGAILGAFNALGFLLGFLVVPAWMLAILSEQQNASRSVRRLLPSWLSEDAWAVVRILDRAFGYFVRGQVVSGLVTGVLVYVGLVVLVNVLGIPSRGRYEVVLAIFAGLTQLIPIIGPFLGALPGVLIGFTISPELGIGGLIVYVLVQLIIENVVNANIQQRVARLNPNLLLLFIVALSQLGFFWVLLAAPVTGIFHDVFRYFYGRLSDPHRPAGVIPGDTAWQKWNPARAAVLNPNQPPSKSRSARLLQPAAEPNQEQA